jgi:myo-inositol 2-dehydrogenase/D-chiro-inositol 1-dehydrogenase
MGVHEFDQIRWLTGGEIEVASAIASEVSGGEPDSVLVTARLSGGGTAVVSLGLHRRGGDACWAEVMGTRDWARIEFMVGTPAQRVFRQALVNQVDAFAGFVRGETAAGADGSDAVAAITAAERTAACLEVV